MRTSHRRRLALAAAALPLTLAALTGCGSDEGESASDETSSSASSPAESESATPEADASASSSAETPAEGEEVDPAEFAEQYQAAFEKETTAHMRMETAGSASFSAEGDIDYSTNPPAMTMTMTGPMAEEAIDIRLVDGTFYMAMPGSKGKFYRFDLDDPNNPLGPDFAKQLDPANAFAQFEDAIKTVTFVGEESVDGEDMRRYTLVVDGTKITGAAGAQVPKGALPAELSYDAWFDGEGFFRKMTSDLGQAGTLTMTVDDWGKDVTVEAPPASQVTTMPGMPSMSPAG